jgi:hypothetical protein
MKKYILTVGGALLAFSIAALAGPLNTKGIPANAAFVCHVDFEAGEKSPIYQFFLGNEGHTRAAYPEFFQTLKNEYGIDFPKDIKDITIGLSFPADGKGQPEQVTSIIRGKFSLDKDKALAAYRKKSPGIDITPIGKYSAIGQDKALLILLDSSTVAIVAAPGSKNSHAAAAAFVAAYEGTAPSYVSPASLVAFSKQAGASPIVLAYMDGTTLPPNATAGVGIAPPKGIYYSVGDDGKNVKLRVKADFSSTTEAQQAQAAAQGALGYLQMATANTNGKDGKPDPKKVAAAIRLSKVVTALKLDVTDKNFNAALDYSTDETLQFIKEMIAAQKAARAGW